MGSQAPAWLRLTSGGTAPDGDEGDAPAPRTAPRVLFVCTGNICRSAFAAASLRHLLGPHSPVEVSSAGIMALAGHPMDGLMAAEAKRLGIEDTSHTARQLTGRHLKEAALVLVFGPEHAEWITSNHPEHLGKVAGLGQVASALDTAPRHALLPLSDLPGLAGGHRAPGNRDWIPDPYRRGPEAALSAAERIAACTALLAVHVDWSR
ncbi:MAG: hypothetical protein LKI27_01810 [Actinomyces sp.]|nr:hypothetical protein [Actinomyces sp.]MCI1661625.1 hypothetical protein [Actinomyces sp.]